MSCATSSFVAVAAPAPRARLTVRLRDLAPRLGFAIIALAPLWVVVLSLIAAVD